MGIGHHNVTDGIALPLGHADLAAAASPLRPVDLQGYTLDVAASR